MTSQQTFRFDAEGLRWSMKSLVNRAANSNSRENEFCNILSQCESISEEVVIIGDFNFNLLDQKQKAKWNNGICKPCSLPQLITKATRVVESCSSLIDHVYSTRPNILI